MKSILLFYALTLSLPVFAGPHNFHGPGPLQIQWAPGLTPKSPQVDCFAVQVLTLKCQKQLFDSEHGKRILQRSANLKENYVTNVRTDKLGNPQDYRDQFARAKTGRKAQLETDIDHLIESKWNKPTVLKKPMEYEQIFVIKITPEGQGHVYPMVLGLHPLSLQ